MYSNVKALNEHDSNKYRSQLATQLIIYEQIGSRGFKSNVGLLVYILVLYV